MEQQPEIVSKRRPETRLKTLKDLSFLLQHKPTPVDQHSTKYILEEGEGDIIDEIPHHFSIVYSSRCYDYEGKFVNIIKEGRINKSDKKDSSSLNNQIHNYLMGMKIKEKAWFNVCSTKIFRTKDVDKEIEDLQDCGLIDDDYNQTDLLDEFEEMESIDKTKRTGHHHEVTVLRLEYKNQETMEGKRLVHQQKKEEGRNHFQKKEYAEALRIYKFLVDIYSNCSRKFYSEQEFFELEDMANNSRVNYIRCYFKMIEQKDQIEPEMEENGKFFLYHLLDKQSNNCVIHFLHAKWLLKERMLDGALQAAKKSYSLRKEEGTYNLIKLIEEERRNKGKIKMKVEG